MIINLLPKKEIKKAIGKTLHIATMLALIFNMSMLGVFVAPKAASAARTPNSATVNGGLTTNVAPSAPVTVAFTVTTDSSDNDWKSSEYRIEGGSWTCVNTPDHTSSGTNTESFTITAPSGIDVYNLDLRAYSDNSCNNGQSSTLSLTDAINVVSIPWPQDNQWTVPVCNDDPANDENPSSVDLKASGSEYGAAYYTDTNNLYVRERVDGNPGTPGNWDQYAWVLMIQQNVATTNYDYLISLRGSGQGENVELWQNTNQNGPISWSPIFTDVAETQLNTWNTSDHSRMVTVGSDYYVDWQIPISELTSRGVNLLNSGLYFATSTNANNYNKDHLNCYNSPDVRILKELRKNNSGNWFTDGRTASVQTAPGDTLNYRVTVTNVGGPTTSSTTVTDELGKGDAADGSANIDPATQYSNWMSTFNLNSDGNGNSFSGSWGNGSNDGQPNDTLTTTIPLISGGGSSEQFSFDGVVKNDIPVGTSLFENTATTGQQTSETDIQAVRVGQCDLTITKSVANITHPNGPNVPNDVLEYTILYGNNGTADCTGGGVRIDDVIPTGTTYVNGSATGSNGLKIPNQNDPGNDGTHFGYTSGKFGPDNPGFNGSMLSWNAHVLSAGNPGETGTVKFRVTVNSLAECQDTTISNVAKIYSNEFPNGITSSPATTTSVTAPCHGDLTVNKYFDDNGDGQVDRTNPQGWTWDITNGDQNITGGTTKTLTPNTYEVTEDPIAGYSSTWTCSNQTNGSDTHFNVNVVAQGDIICSFTNTRDTGDLRIKKYNDLNGNGVKDENEPYMTGWHFNVTQNDNPIAEGNTGDDGDFLIIENLPTGNYDVTETPQGGWINTDPGTNPITKTVSVTNGLTNVWFGNFNLGEIDACKYNDLNGNGIKSENEPSLSSWTMILSKDGHDLASQITGDDGCTSFGGLQYGTYQVREALQNGWTQTQPADGTYAVAVQSGTFEVRKFGNFQNISISGMKFNDHNGNGIKDNDDEGLADWTIFIDANGNGTLDVGETSTTTAGDGSYSLTDLGPGTYKVREVQQGGWTQTTTNPADINAVSGTNVDSINFGNFHNVSVTACKLVDADGNTQTTGDQTPKAGWTVHLSKNGETVDTKTTGENGCYTWTDLAPGFSYDVSEATPEDWTPLTDTSHDFGPAVSGGDYSYTFVNFENINVTVCKYIDANGDHDLTGDQPYQQGWTVYLDENEAVTGENGCHTYENIGPGNYDVTEDTAGWLQTYPNEGSHNFSAVSGEDRTFKFGNFQYGKISGYKYEDVNHNGEYDEGIDRPLEGWTINLIGPVSGTRTTDVNGYYEFTNLTAGDYTVGESYDSNIWWPYMPGSADYHFTVISGYDEQFDFLNYRLGKISGHKFNDLNGNGVLDAGEPGLAGWTINLNGDEKTATTGSDGYYEFAGLLPGTYSVSEEMQGGWVNTTPDTIPGLVIDSSNTILPNNDFLNFHKTSITGMKFNDLNGNHVKDQGDNGLEGWTIKLYKWDGEEEEYIFDRQTTTDADGNYSFADLGPGKYKVEEVQQADWTQTFPNDPNYYQGIELTSGTPVTGKDFGNFRYGRIAGYKYDTQENGLPGWQICLNTEQCTATNADGYYEFTGLTAGEYNVKETLQYGWTNVSPALTGYDITIQSGTGYGEAPTMYNFINRQNDFNVSIDKSAPATVNAGEQMTYTLNWTVTGNTPVDTTITDPLPANTTFVSAANGGVYDAGTNTITWNLGTKNPVDSGTVTFVVQIASPLTNSSIITNTAQICGLGALVPIQESFALTQKCDSDETTTTVHSTVTGALTKTNTPDPVAAGANISYTVNWTISGNADSTNTRITDPLPVNTTFVSVADGGVYDAATNTITWTLGTQHPGASGSVHFVAKANSPLPNGTIITNTAHLKSTEIDPQIDASSTTHVTSAPILGITKVVDVTTFVNPGATVNYTVTIKNTGTDTAVNVQLTDLLPTGFTYTDLGGSSHTFSLGNLAAGAQTSVTYKVTVGASVVAGTYENLAVGSADNHPNITAKVPVEVRVPTVLGEEAAPVLTITKSVDKAFINSGGSIVYTVIVKNTGDATAVNVQVQDVLPAGFTFEDKSITKVFSLGDLAPGASAKITYKAIADKKILPGTYENFAIAFADNFGKVSAKAPIEVRAVKVLGEQLPVTGGSALIYLYFFITGLLTVASLYQLKRVVSERSS